MAFSERCLSRQQLEAHRLVPKYPSGGGIVCVSQKTGGRVCDRYQWTEEVPLLLEKGRKKVFNRREDSKWGQMIL
ncbi:unnamed protein product [Protopolystoma xenopodis]|uniref:Uncharacterized protein n=1 Tax=Protopolystoma xenopodis TaxID=117903 RepID=A0A3S5CLU4_9PLAT|nr:unnamed protein product [Protopolystoma xenopodis]